MKTYLRLETGTSSSFGARVTGASSSSGERVEVNSLYSPGGFLKIGWEMLGPPIEDHNRNYTWWLVHEN